MKIFLIISQLILFVSTQNITWNGDWAFNCDFHNSDLSSIPSNCSDCSSYCLKTPGCTHFTWTSNFGGTCWMKKGPVLKNNAFYDTSVNKICGVITSALKSSFPYCQFKSGRSFDAKVTNYSNFDHISIWLGLISNNYGTNFDPTYHGKMIDICKQQNKIPVFYAYIIAFEARYNQGIQDCDVDTNNNLCIYGAQYIRQNRQYLVQRYAYQSTQIATRFGRNNVALFLIEPDFWCLIIKNIYLKNKIFLEFF